MKKVLFVFAVAATMVACCGQGAKSEGCESKCAAETSTCCDSTAAATCEAAAVEAVDTAVVAQ